MANKMVEMTFAIGAALTGGFNSTFGKAGQALGQLQQQSAELQKMSGQVSGYQKMQDAITKNQAAMVEARNQAKALESQITSSSQKTAALKSQYGEAQAKVESLNAVLVRNRDAYKAAQLNAQSLENQIKNSKAPTAELQKQYARAQEEVRRLGGAVKQSATDFKNAQTTAKRLKSEMQNSASQTKALTNEAKNLNAQADKLQTGLDRDREALAKMRSELSGAGIDTKNLASEQQRLTAQSQRAAEAQTRLQNSRAALAATRQQLSFNNIKGELMTAAGLGYSLYKPVSQAADFEQAMARVNAVAFSGGGRDKAADAEAFKALQEQARQLGRDTQYTAVQAAQSQENLARAGFKSNEIISAMPGLLNMAAAEGMDLANAADITASALRGFNLNADQSNRVADVLAQASAASNTNIAMLGESLKMCAPSAAGLGVSIEQTAAMLGVMANNGIKGTESGTALRNVFLRLSQEPKQVEKALKKLGIASKDAQGNMRELPEIMLALHEKIKDYGKADQMKYLADIFGARAVTGAMAVMNGAVDGSLQKLEWLEKESNGIMTAILEHVNKGSENAIVSLDEMRAGMEEAGNYARELGISYKDLTISLALLARGGIKGAQADKGLTAAFKQLSEQPEKVQTALKQFNISAYGKDGRMKEFPVLLSEIRNSVMGIKDQTKRLNLIESIFGKGSGSVIQALLKTMTDETLAAYNEVADKATGVSKEMADKVNNTMRGAWIQTQSAVSDLMIEVGDVLLPTVTDIVKSFKEWTSWLGKLAHENPEWTKAIVGTVGALAALKVGLVGVKIGWNLIKLPFQTAKVALDTFHVQALASANDLAENGKKAGLFSRAVQGISKGARGIGNAFKAIGKGISSFFKGIFNMGKNLINGLFSPMGLKILAIAGIIAAVAATVYLIYKNWDKIKEWWNSWTFKDIFAPVKEYAAIAKDYVVEKWSYAKTKIAAGWNELKGQFGEKFPVTFASLEAAATNIVSMFGGIGQTIHGIFTLDVYEIGEGLIITFESAFNVIGAGADFVEKTWEQAKDIISSSWNDFRSQFGDSYKNTFDGIEKLASESVGFIEGAGKTIKGLLTFDFSGAFEGLLQAFSSACGMIKGAWESVTGFIKDTWDTVSEYVSGAWKWTKGLFGVDTDAEDLQAQIQDITVLNKMSEGFAQRVAEMTAAWQPFKASLGEGFEQIYSTMHEIADKIRGVTIPAVNELTNALSKVASEITSIVKAGELNVKVETQKSSSSWFSWSSSRAERHATGGIFSQPHIGVVAEAGREAIIPLEDLSRGTSLWLAAGRELGLLSDNGKSDHIPLWKAASDDSNLARISTINNNNSTTNTNDNHARIAPVFNFTFNGSSQPEDKQSIMQMFREAWAEFQEQEMRVSFA